MAAFWTYDWGIWASLFIGVSVSGLVLFVGGKLLPGLRRRRSAVSEEDLPWEDLLGLLKTRYAAGGKSPENEELSSDELLATLLADQPKWAGASGDTEFEPGHPENRAADRPIEFAAVPDAGWQAGDNRRASRRRDANPVEVMLISAFHENPVHGLVINRSTGGLAILTDFVFPPDTTLTIQVVDVPKGTAMAYVRVRVRHARQVSKLWIIGCQYTEEVPWNVKVWFG